MINKKGVTASVLVAVIIGLVIIVSMIPVYLAYVDQARVATYECQNVIYPILNDSTKLCTNATGVSVYLFNQSATPTGLSPGSYLLLIFVVMLLVIAFIAITAKSLGLIDS